MSFYKELSVKNEIIDDILERKTNGISPLLNKKRIASRFNFLTNVHDLFYFASLPTLFFIYTKRNSGRNLYYLLGGVYGLSFLSLGYYKKFKVEEVKKVLQANDEDLNMKLNFYSSFIRDKYDPYENLTKN